MLSLLNKRCYIDIMHGLMMSNELYFCAQHGEKSRKEGNDTRVRFDDALHPSATCDCRICIHLSVHYATFLQKRADSRWLKLSGIIAWFLTFLGLVTGMLWAQAAWGSYWSWDPKETMTLLLFLSISTSLAGLIENNRKISRALAVFSCIFVILTISTSFVTIGLHSFASTIFMISVSRELH